MERTAVSQPVDKTVPTPGGVLQRACACGQHTGGGECAECQKKREAGLQRVAVSTGPQVAPPIVHDVLHTSGQPLDTGARAALEPHFGHDFSHVRVHTDARAATSAEAVDARAYTVGQHIAFGAGNYAPDTQEGQSLLAHELTHVVQQRDAARPAGELRLGAPDDAYERAAEAHAASVAAGETPGAPAAAPAQRVQGSFLSGLLDVLLFIPRLFGLEYFPAEDLREYLNGLRQRKGPEDSMFSDNKARACVSRESEFGPYDAQTKIWLIQEMLGGHTSFLDENAIIALLRRSPTERRQIVAGVGRDRLWGKFSGQKRHMIEAMTLTAADAGDALVSRLRSLGPEELQVYAANTSDPAVQESVRRAAALARITAPIPASAAVDPQGVASFQINGIELVARPDTTSNDEKYRNRAFTTLELQPTPIADAMVNSTTNTITSFTPPRIRGSVQTTFGPGYQPGGSSGYGRGTTTEDVAAGNTSLRFHEGRHSAAWFDFLRQNAPPVFRGAVGMSLADFQRAEDQYAEDFRQYAQRSLNYSVQMTDCPGTPATEEQLAPFGLSATICHQR